MIELIRTGKRLIHFVCLIGYDLKTLFKWSCAFKPATTGNHLESIMTVYCHELERGLSLPEPRIGFGRETADRFMACLAPYRQLCGKNSFYFNSLKTLTEWARWNLESGAADRPHYKQILQKFGHEVSSESVGGARTISRSRLFESNDFDFPSFVKARHSIRHFTCGEVDVGVIREAVDIAKYSPSACNRQPFRIHVISDKKDINYINHLQGGTAGFFETINKMIFLSTDVQYINQISEYKQAWIDTSLFAMNLLLALHWLKVGAVPLNWNAAPRKDRRIKKYFGIGDSEWIILRIAVGRIPEHLAVAASARKDADGYMTLH